MSEATVCAFSESRKMISLFRISQKIESCRIVYQSEQEKDKKTAKKGPYLASCPLWSLSVQSKQVVLHLVSIFRAAYT